MLPLPSAEVPGLLPRADEREAAFAGFSGFKPQGTVLPILEGNFYRPSAKQLCVLRFSSPPKNNWTSPTRISAHFISSNLACVAQTLLRCAQDQLCRNMAPKHEGHPAKSLDAPVNSTRTGNRLGRFPERKLSFVYGIKTGTSLSNRPSPSHTPDR